MADALAELLEWLQAQAVDAAIGGLDRKAAAFLRRAEALTAAISELETLRKERDDRALAAKTAKANCKHHNATGSGMLSSSDEWASTGYCPDCGASWRYSNPPVQKETRAND